MLTEIWLIHTRIKEERKSFPTRLYADFYYYLLGWGSGVLRVSNSPAKQMSQTFTGDGLRRKLWKQGQCVGHSASHLLMLRARPAPPCLSQALGRLRDIEPSVRTLQEPNLSSFAQKARAGGVVLTKRW